MKITAKTTKEQLMQALNANYKTLKTVDKSLAERVAYTGKKKDTATRKDLVDLVKEVATALGEKFVDPTETVVKTDVTTEVNTPETKKGTEETKKTVAKKTSAEKTEKPVVENSVKKPIKKVAAETEEKTTTKATKISKKTADKTESKTETAKAAKKSSKKGSAVDLTETSSSAKAIQFAVKFPETIEVEGEVFKIDHSVKTIEDLAEGTFEFAFWWTKKHLKQFPYFNDWLGHPKSFPDDLDTAQLIYVSDEGKIAYAVSDATEALYKVLPEDLEEFEGMRYSNSIEYQIYRKVEELTEDDEDDEEDES